MSEYDLERNVRRLIARHGLYGYHNPDSRRSAPGWPDWVFIGRGGLLFRELKSPYGQVSGPQRHVGYLLQAAGQSWDVWRPLDLQTGRLDAELAALAVSPQEC